MTDPFFQQFFGGRGRMARAARSERGWLGSGVIVIVGYILTNNHVVDKATTLKSSCWMAASSKRR